MTGEDPNFDPYEVKVKVTIDMATGKILKAIDDGTVYEDNQGYYDKVAKAVFPMFTDKTAADLPLKQEDIDGVSGATKTLDAMNKAVKAALEAK